ncbi:phosphatase PAP2 family protein [Variovorax ginsengisoli]|uniref:Membrane-associated PAP2 superfamily phosphatase n=1 Tax=Variovorax ginsengisoli TaxID=363844 RepID=A0ABT9S5F6_9BURK|nr:phosphatase PAP2 family protein [Variovorax ginsengisoli]MDP9899119.1 membrane-associated PAP2 superfamily phosphatase [Variovorax ginsengisoli]
MNRSSTPRLLVLTFAFLAIVLLWDLSGLDLPLARLAATPHGFPWRDSRALLLVMHEGPRLLSWLLLFALFVAVRWPVGFLRQVDLPARLQLAATVLVSVLAVSLIKSASSTSCPWDLAEFGGTARHVSHWAWGVADGGPGRCFPAGHASAAFAYLGGWFALRTGAPVAARRWLAVAIVVGFALGLGQQWRGAHYMSHTLWTAWVCWAVGLVIDLGVQAVRRQRARAGLAVVGN